MAAVPSETPSSRRLGGNAKRIGAVLVTLAVVAVIVTVAVAKLQHDSHPAFKCVPAEGVSSGHRASNPKCFANTKTTGVGVTKPKASPGASSP